MKKLGHLPLWDCAPQARIRACFDRLAPALKPAITQSSPKGTFSAAF